MLESVDGETVAQVEQRDQAAVLQGNASQAAQMDGSAASLVKAAGSSGAGGFKLDPAVAANLAAACSTAMEHIRDMEGDLTTIQQAPNLGTLQGAQTVANYTLNVATDPQGMLQAMQSLKATLQQMHDAYIQASTNYQETNTDIANILNKMDGGQSNAAAPGTTTTPATSNPNSGPHFS
ncbi:MAG TPA: hypothetical protein VGN81_06440 [Pseudonocardiaceae bacterium]|jgi:hypothetical protein